MAIKRCENCNGRKSVMGIGGMKKDCEPCKAIGWVEDNSIIEKKIIEKENLVNMYGDLVPTVKKKQRRQRIEE